MTENPRAPTTRPLTPDDLEAVVAIDRRITGQSRRGFFEKRLARTLRDPEGFLYIGLTADGTLAGHAFARLIEGEFGGTAPVALLDIIGVDPQVRGRGYGRLLLAGIDGIMRRKSIKILRTQTLWSDVGLLRFLDGEGFALSSRRILERPVAAAIDPPDETPDRDTVLIRSLEQADVPVLVRIDRKITGLDRAAYFSAKAEEALSRDGVRISLVAESDGMIVGFIMARVDLGEFGQLEAAAAIDTIGVHPDFTRRRVGRALLSQLLANLGSLRVETVRTETWWRDDTLIPFLADTGFGPSQILVFQRLAA